MRSLGPSSCSGCSRCQRDMSVPVGAAAPSGLACSLRFCGLQLPLPHLDSDGGDLHYLSLQDAHGWKKNKRDKHPVVCTHRYITT